MSPQKWSPSGLRIISQGGCDPMRYAVALAAMLLAGAARAEPWQLCWPMDGHISSETNADCPIIWQENGATWSFGSNGEGPCGYTIIYAYPHLPEAMYAPSKSAACTFNGVP